MYWIGNLLSWAGFKQEEEIKEEQGPNPELLKKDSYSAAFKDSLNNSNICNEPESESDDEADEIMADIPNKRESSTSIKIINETLNELDIVETEQAEKQKEIEREQSVESVECANFKKGEIVYRKGIACKIITIHYDMMPPTVTVKNIIDKREINTEFAYLTSQKEFVRAQKDKITKELFKRFKEPKEAQKEAVIEHKIVVTKDPKDTNKDKEVVINKKKKNVKKPGKSPRKKSGHIAQLQKPPTKSKRKRKIVKAKRMNDRKITKIKQKKENKLLAAKKKKMNKKSPRKSPRKSTKTDSTKIAKKVIYNPRKRRFSAIDDAENVQKEIPSIKRRKIIVKEDNENICIVEKIYGERTIDEQTEYLMKLKGSTMKESVWRKSDNSESVNAAIEQFQKDQQNTQRKKYMLRVVKQVNAKNQEQNKNEAAIKRIMEIIGCELEEAESAYFERSNEDEQVAINYLLEKNSKQ